MPGHSSTSSIRAVGPANIKRLREALALDAERFETGQSELVEAGLAEAVGRGGRLARKVSDAGNLSVEAQMLFSALPADGTLVGNYSLRSQLELDDETYAAAKRELRTRGLIGVGVGYGGTIGRLSVSRETQAPEDESSAAQRNLVTREYELYEPFVEWLRSSLEDQELAFSHVRITGYRRGGGKWSRPDVTAVQVFRYEWLPDITVEVSTYEIKRSADSEKLESPYEAAAHGRWAHRASLIVEMEEEQDVPPAVFDEVRHSAWASTPSADDHTARSMSRNASSHH